MRIIDNDVINKQPMCAYMFLLLLPFLPLDNNHMHYLI